MKRHFGRGAAGLAFLLAFSGLPAGADQHEPVQVITIANTYWPGDDSHPDGTFELTIRVGQSMKYRNLDFAPHNIMSDDDTNGIPFFYTETTNVLNRNQPLDVHGVGSLSEGSYGFYCSVHEFMRGTLHVESD